MYVLKQVTRTQVWQQCVVLSVLFHSGNLYGPGLVFITECKFHNTEMGGNTSVELWYKSGVHTYRSEKWCLIQTNNYFWRYGSHRTAGIPVNIYNYEVLKKKIEKQKWYKYKENISNICFLISSIAGKILWFILVLGQLFNCHKNTWLVLILIPSNPVITTRVIAKLLLRG